MLCKSISYPPPRFGRLSGSRFVRTGASGRIAPSRQDPSPLLAPRPGLQAPPSAGIAPGAPRCGRDACAPEPVLAASRPGRTPAPCRNPRRAHRPRPGLRLPIGGAGPCRSTGTDRVPDAPTPVRLDLRRVRSSGFSPLSTALRTADASAVHRQRWEAGSSPQRPIRTPSPRGRVSRPCPEPYVTTMSKEQESEHESSLHARPPVGCGFLAKRLEHERRR